MGTPTSYTWSLGIERVSYLLLSFQHNLAPFHRRALWEGFLLAERRIEQPMSTFFALQENVSSFASMAANLLFTPAQRSSSNFRQ